MNGWMKTLPKGYPVSDMAEQFLTMTKSLLNEAKEVGLEEWFGSEAGKSSYEERAEIWADCMAEFRNGSNGRIEEM
jgi:hypothetical protein